ncbi:MAG TPA: hypothetical protein VGT98_14460 [Candidatus Elarobacter sp.]|nr:hypothetical protein [Candidatus Elarobacter sp.]
MMLSAIVVVGAPYVPRGTAPTSGVTYRATEFAFTGPDTIAAGVVMVRLVNTGHEAHQLTLYRVEPSADLAAVMRTLGENRVRPANVTRVGGVEGVAPSGADSVAMALRPGRYVIVCGLPSLDGESDASKGMLRELVVRGPLPRSRAATLPRADVIVVMTEYDFVLSAPLRAGTQRVRVENAGHQTHQLIVSRLHPGVTRADVDEWNGKGLSLFDDMGGVAALDPGQVNVWAVTLTPGNYLISCVIRDAGDGRPHFMHGMERVVKVRARK